VTLARVSVTFFGSGLPGRTIERVTLLAAGPSSSTRRVASDISRVEWSPIDSIMSPSVIPALSAGPPGTTETTVP